MDGLTGGGSANLGTLRAFLGLDTKGLDIGAAQARMKMSMLEKSMTGSTARMSMAGSALTGMMGKASLAIGGFIAAAMGVRAAVNEFRKAVTVGASFEQQMTTVGGVMRATAEDMTMVTDVARLMGETTEWTATQAGQALYYLASAGFNARQSAEALPGVLDLATAANVDLARSADIAANSLHAFGLPIEELGRVNDVFVGTFTRTNVLMDDMAESMKYAAPAAKAFGYSIEELAGLIGTLGNAGIKGSMAGTQLSMAMLQAAKAAKKYGYDSADLLDVLDAMTKEGKDTLEVLEGFGIRAGRAALVLKDMSGEARALQETLGGVGGEAKTLADKMRSTIGGAWRELISVMESLRIDVFGVFRDELKNSVTAMTSWLRENKAKILDFVRTIKISLGAIRELISPIVGVLRRFLSASVDVFSSFDKQVNESKDNLRIATADMRMSLKEFSRAVADSFGPPDVSSWSALWEELKRGIYNVTELFIALGRSTGAVLYGISKGFYDLAATIVKSSGELYAVMKQEAGRAFNPKYWFKDIDFIAQAKENLKRVGSPFKELWKEWGKDVDWTGEQLNKSWGRLAGEWDTRSGAQILTDKWLDSWGKEWAAARPTMAQNMEYAIVGAMADGIRNAAPLAGMSLERLAGMKSPGEQIMAAISAKREAQQGGKFNIHTAKPVGGGAADDTEGLRSLIDQQVQLYDRMLAQNGVARDELISIWNKYRIARKAQLDLTLKDLKGNAVMAKDTADQYAREMQEKWESIFKAPIDDSAYRSRLDKETSFYESLLANAKLSADGMLAVWAKYADSRKEQIDQEIKDLGKAGHSTEFIALYKAFSMEGVHAKQRELFTSQGNWIKQWAKKLGLDLANIFDETFFLTMKGDWDSLLRYLEDSFLRMIARMASNDLMRILGQGKDSWSGLLSLIPGGGGASAGAVPSAAGTSDSLYGSFAGGLGSYATGAIIMRPEIARIGEVPEAVIPLSKLSDPNFINSIGGAANESGGNVYVTQNIKTDDAASFKASQSQIMSRAQVSMSMAARRNG